MMLLHCGVVVCAQQLEKRGHRRAVHSAASFSTNSTEPNTPSSSSGSIDEFLSADSTTKSSSIQRYKHSRNCTLSILTNNLVKAYEERASESAANSTSDVSSDVSSGVSSDVSSNVIDAVYSLERFGVLALLAAAVVAALSGSISSSTAHLSHSYLVRREKRGGAVYYIYQLSGKIVGIIPGSWPRSIRVVLVF
eukprot:3312-Heterococcus_DN1.PRE.8